MLLRPAARLAAFQLIKRHVAGKAYMNLAKLYGRSYVDQFDASPSCTRSCNCRGEMGVTLMSYSSNNSAFEIY